MIEANKSSEPDGLWFDTVKQMIAPQIQNRLRVSSHSEIERISREDHEMINIQMPLSGLSKKDFADIIAGLTSQTKLKGMTMDMSRTQLESSQVDDLCTIFRTKKTLKFIELSLIGYSFDSELHLIL